MPENNNNATPFSLRLTPEEREELNNRAAGEPLGSYVRARLFSESETPRRRRGRTPVKDHMALAQCLGRLGQSGLADSLKELASAARLGALPLTDDTETALQRAAADIAEIKRLLMRALGIRER